MRQIKQHERHCAANAIDHRFVGGRVQFEFTLQRGRRGEQREALGLAHEQAVQEHFIDALWREQRLGDALGLVLVEIEADRAERQVEIHQRGIGAVAFGDAPGQVMSQR